MTQTYNLTGMTCNSCVAKVKTALLSVNSVTKVEVSKENNTTTITMDKHIPLSNLQIVLDSKYDISVGDHNETTEQAKPWFETYKPVLLIFIYIFSAAGLIELTAESINTIRWMRHFMAGFFLTFSFFKF